MQVCVAAYSGMYSGNCIQVCVFRYVYAGTCMQACVAAYSGMYSGMCIQVCVCRHVSRRTGGFALFDKMWLIPIFRVADGERAADQVRLGA